MYLYRTLFSGRFPSDTILSKTRVRKGIANCVTVEEVGRFAASQLRHVILIRSVTDHVEIRVTGTTTTMPKRATGMYGHHVLFRFHGRKEFLSY